MNKFLTLITFAALLLFSNRSPACRMVSLEKSPQKYIQKMIKGTADVYVAEAVSYSKTDEAFTFKVIETVRGEKKESLLSRTLFYGSGAHGGTRTPTPCGTWT